ncbi:prolyl oligopeptidase family serine peptidase [Paenibacillus donghaensis]|uniref:alpha/beta hydrolase family protein n=1 Tax=Paenibacillus donghaensis TaxID=414771 RepID=UPI0018832D99|nr:CocE/NonD family hydrolase [Paenibacillus donghaensis]MBE9914116.1 prolyl oligopeptidase family serine peptidase [Paenibacillus donghaensis]
MKKKITISIMIIVLLLGGAGLYILKQHSFDMVEQAIEIPTPQGKMKGTFVLPKNYTGKLGLVLFIHGDGPVDSTLDGGYRHIWERIASAGYASLSLSKPGINGSEGNWLDQSIDDRVEEARHAIAWAKAQPMIDETKIGTWGASQAGWVIPKLAGKEPLAFNILVGPAINWLNQGEYNTRMQMKHDGYTEAEIEKVVARGREVRKLLKDNASYDEYLKLVGEKEAMSKERWTFVGKNFMSDATDDLRLFRSPVLVLLGDKDINVDSKETEQVYRRIVPPELLKVVVFADTEHRMMSTKTADSEFRALMISIFAPRQITVPEYLDEIEEFLKKNPQPK